MSYCSIPCDTVRFRIPLSKYQFEQFYSNFVPHISTVKFKNGDFAEDWQSTKYQIIPHELSGDIPSWSSKPFFTYKEKTAAMELEFSFNKYLFGHQYYYFTEWYEFLQAFERFIAPYCRGLFFPGLEHWEITRFDFCLNFQLGSEARVQQEYKRLQKSFYRGKPPTKYAHWQMAKGGSRSIKFYPKSQEAKKHAKSIGDIYRADKFWGIMRYEQTWMLKHIRRVLNKPEGRIYVADFKDVPFDIDKELEFIHKKFSYEMRLMDIHTALKEIRNHYRKPKAYESILLDTLSYSLAWVKREYKNEKFHRLKSALRKDLQIIVEDFDPQRYELGKKSEHFTNLYTKNRLITDMYYPDLLHETGNPTLDVLRGYFYDIVTNR